MKTSIRRAGQSQMRVQQQQQRGTFPMPPNPPPLQKTFTGVSQQQITALDRAYLSSGQAEPVQLTANPVAIERPANVWRQQINTINPAAIPVPMILHTQSGHRVQASTWYGNIRSSESPGRVEEARRDMVQMSTLEPSTRTANLNTPYPREQLETLLYSTCSCLDVATLQGSRWEDLVSLSSHILRLLHRFRLAK
jgi:hypothetical protein